MTTLEEGDSLLHVIQTVLIRLAWSHAISRRFVPVLSA